MADDSFDPYLEWLGIGPTEHPVDHYRLLGISRFESNAAEIEHGADERMGLVRSFQTGPRGKYTQKLLNEMSAAKLCLLNPNTKATYDAVLEGQLAATAVSNEPLAPPVTPRAPVPPGNAAATSVAEPPPPSATAVYESAEAPRISASIEKENATPLYARSWFPFAVFGAVILVAGAVWLIGGGLSTSGGVQNDSTARQPQPQPKQPVVPTEHTPKEIIKPPVDDVIVKQEGDRGFNFPASVATIHGSTAQLVTRGDTSVISNWTSSDDWLSWEYQVTDPGFFSVEVEYAAAESSEGAQFEIEAQDFKRVRDVRVSESAEEFVTDEFVVALRQGGRDTLKVRPAAMPNGELMTLKSIRFVPRRGN